MNIVQSGNQPVGSTPCQVSRRNSARSDRETAGADRTSTGNVAFRIPDHDHFLSGGPGTEFQLRPLAGNGGNPVAVLVVVSESPHGEFVPQSMGP